MSSSSKHPQHANMSHSLECCEELVAKAFALARALHQSSISTKVMRVRILICLGLMAASLHQPFIRYSHMLTLGSIDAKQEELQPVRNRLGQRVEQGRFYAFSKPTIPFETHSGTL
jgi:hypothetical protein